MSVSCNAGALTSCACVLNMVKTNNAIARHKVFIRLICFFPTTSFLTPLPEIHQELYFHFVKFSLKDFLSASVFLYLASIFMPLLQSCYAVMILRMSKSLI